MDRREEKLEQYEDAALALLMETHAQSDGQELLAEFEQAKALGEDFRLSPEESKRSDRLISATFRRLRLRKSGRTLRRFAARAALWLAVLIPMAAATILVVDANNQVYIQRLLENSCSVSDLSDRYLIHFRLYPNSKEQDHEKISQIMAGLTSRGYTLTREYLNDFGIKDQTGLSSLYTDAQGHTVNLESCMSISGKLIQYKDGCTARELSYMGYDMVLIEWENARQIHWLDDEEGLRYSLYSDGLTEQQFWDLIYELALA